MTWWQTVASVALGGAVSAGTTILSQWMANRRRDRDLDRELLREVLRQTVRFRRMARKAIESAPGGPDHQQRQDDLLEAADTLQDVLIEVETFGPTGIAVAAGLAFDELAPLRAAVASGDQAELHDVTNEMNERTLFLVDGIRQKLHLRDRYQGKHKRPADGPQREEGSSPPQMP